MTLPKYHAIAAFVIFLFVLMLVVGSDYDNAKQDQATYCQMVKEGVWPDYQKTAKEFCK